MDCGSTTSVATFWGTSLEVEVFVGRCVEIDRAETEAHVATLRLSGRTGVSACTRTILRGELSGALLNCGARTQRPEGPRMF